MVGQGVLRECLCDPDVSLILSVGRTTLPIQHPKLHQIEHSDMQDLTPIEAHLLRLDACFFCLGVSSSGMKEAEYRQVTLDITLAVANTLVRLNPQMTFIYVSGMGTDSTEVGRTMWARVKGKTENALLKMPFHAYMFRPGLIVPLHGIRSKTRAYRILYTLTKPILPWLRRAFPNAVLTTEEVGKAMLIVARRGAPTRILESKDIRALLS